MQANCLLAKPMAASARILVCFFIYCKVYVVLFYLGALVKHRCDTTDLKETVKKWSSYGVHVNHSCNVARTVLGLQKKHTKGIKHSAVFQRLRLLEILFMCIPNYVCSCSCKSGLVAKQTL